MEAGDHAVDRRHRVRVDLERSRGVRRRATPAQEQEELQEPLHDEQHDGVWFRPSGSSVHGA
jgi:hypothetical protein